MIQHSKLLLAVTDTPSARHAGGQGIALAASIGANVVGVSVCPSYEGNMSRLYIKDMQESIEAPHKKILAEFKDLAEKAGVPYRAVMPEGQPFEAIVDTADAENADMIVLGGMSGSRLERSVLGATAVRVIGYARRDVLVVPENTSVSFSEILLATDGSRYSVRAAQRAVDLARAYGGKLHAVSVIDVPSDYHLWEKAMDDFTVRARTALDDVAEQATSAGVEVATHVLMGDAADSIVLKAEEIGAGLVVLGSHGRTGLRRLMLGSVAAGVLRKDRFPVLVVP